jgi:hypothetical protein
MSLLTMKQLRMIAMEVRYLTVVACPNIIAEDMKEKIERQKEKEIKVPIVFCFVKFLCN